MTVFPRQAPPSELFHRVVRSARVGYRQNSFFWFYHLGWVALLLWGITRAGVTPGTLGLWAPAAAVVAYPVGVRVGGYPPGAVALWCSLAAGAVAGATVLDPDLTRVGYHPGGGLLLDGVSGPYVFLTVTLVPLVVVASLESIRKNQELYYFWILFLGATLTLCFCASHFLVFYVLFEVLGFPMFLLVGQYGPRPQRVTAAYKFFVYTFGGSAFVLPVLVYLQFWWGTTEVTALVDHQFTQYEQTLFFGLAAVPFAVKIPLVPVHLWLPEAHVEAPTPVSMLLAGLLLKTGGYAFVRFLVPAFPGGAYVWGPALCGVGLFSVTLASVYALVQVDMKRMIAYASVAHMSVVFLGLVSGVPLGVAGATYFMLAHGYTSAGLFAGIGVLYDRYHTRTIRRYGGVAGVMPAFAGLFFVLTLGNLSFPFTGGFAGEFTVLAGVALRNVGVAYLCGGTVFLSLCYSVWLFNRIFYGAVGEVRQHQEATPVELSVLGWSAVGTVGLGFGGAAFVGATQACYAGLLRGTLPG